MDKKPLVNIGALWKNANDSREKMPLKGSIGSKARSVKVMVFRNDKKEEDRHPDYRLVMEVDEEVLKALGIEYRPKTDEECPF